MRPWAKWFIRNRMRWVLYVVLLAHIPIYIGYFMIEAGKEIMKDARMIAKERGL